MEGSTPHSRTRFLNITIYSTLCRFGVLGNLQSQGASGTSTELSRWVKVADALHVARYPRTRLCPYLPPTLSGSALSLKAARRGSTAASLIEAAPIQATKTHTCKLMSWPKCKTRHIATAINCMTGLVPTLWLWVHFNAILRLSHLACAVKLNSYPCRHCKQVL